MAQKTIKIWIAVRNGVETVVGDDGLEYTRFLDAYIADPADAIPAESVRYAVQVTIEEPAAPGAPVVTGAVL
jgi:hypothetical protein